MRAQGIEFTVKGSRFRVKDFWLRDRGKGSGFGGSLGFEVQGLGFRGQG
jgi:hypothetical protein